MHLLWNERNLEKFNVLVANRKILAKSIDTELNNMCLNFRTEY